MANYVLVTGKKATFRNGNSARRFGAKSVGSISQARRAARMVAAMPNNSGLDLSPLVLGPAGVKRYADALRYELDRRGVPRKKKVRKKRRKKATTARRKVPRRKKKASTKRRRRPLASGRRRVRCPKRKPSKKKISSAARRLRRGKTKASRSNAGWLLGCTKTYRRKKRRTRRKKKR